VIELDNTQPRQDHDYDEAEEEQEQQQQPQEQRAQQQRERDSPNMVVTQLDADRTDGEDDVQDEAEEAEGEAEAEGAAAAAAAEDDGIGTTTTMPTQSYPIPQPTQQRQQQQQRQQNDDNNENANDGAGSNVANNNNTHQYDTDPDETQDMAAAAAPAAADPPLPSPPLPRSTAATVATEGDSSGTSSTNQSSDPAVAADSQARQTIADEVSLLIGRQVQAETQRLRSQLSDARQTISCLQSDLQQTRVASRTKVETMTTAHKAELSRLQRQIDSVCASSTTDHAKLQGEVQSLRSGLSSARSRLTEMHAKYQKAKRMAKQRDGMIKNIIETMQQQDDSSPSFSPSQMEPYYRMGEESDVDHDDDAGHDHDHDDDDDDGEIGVDDEETVADVDIADVYGGGGARASVGESKLGTSDDGDKGRRGGKGTYVQQLFPSSPSKVGTSECRVDARRDDTSATGAATSSTSNSATKGLAPRHKDGSSRTDDERKDEEATSKSPAGYSVTVTSKSATTKGSTAVDEQVSSGRDEETKKTSETPLAVAVEQKEKGAKSLSTIEVARVTATSDKTEAEPTVEIGPTAPGPSSKKAVNKPVSKTPRNPYAAIISSKSAPKRSTPPTAGKSTTTSCSDGKDRSPRPRSSDKRSRSASPHSVRISTATAKSKNASVSMVDGGGDSSCGTDIRSLVASAAIAAAQKHGHHQSKKRKSDDGSARGKENRDNRRTNQKSIQKLSDGGSGAPIPSFSLSLSESATIKGTDGTEGGGTGTVSTSLDQGSKTGGGSSDKKRRKRRSTGSTIVIDSDYEEISEDEGMVTKETTKKASLSKDELCAPCNLPARMAPPRRQSKKSPPPETDVPSRGSSVSGRYAYGIKARSSSASANYSRGGGCRRSSNDPEERSYKYQEVVRGKDKRRAMPGHECEQCKEFYDTVCNAEGGKVFDRNKMICDHSRHRSNHSPEQTPKDFWELSFVDEKRNRDTQDV